MRKISFYIGDKLIGDSACLIQSMGDKKTERAAEMISLTDRLALMGMDLMRFSVLDERDVEALKTIKANTSIPIIADIHFDYKLALKSMEVGVDKIRINPGNIGSDAHLREVIRCAKEKRIPIRIGVNSGSLNKYRGKTASKEEDILLAMDDSLQIFKEENFDLLVLSLKTSDSSILEPLYRKAYERYPYPLHLGLTEAGYGPFGITKSVLPLYPLVKDGIGDTIRISLSEDREEEIRTCKALLKMANRRRDIPELILCPGCGRTKVDLREVSREIQRYLDHTFKEIKVACMGCPVNGIGEAKDADIGITGSGVADRYVLFKKGSSLGIYPRDEALSRLFKMIDNF